MYIYLCIYVYSPNFLPCFKSLFLEISISYLRVKDEVLLQIKADYGINLNKSQIFTAMLDVRYIYVICNININSKQYINH